MRVEFWKLSDRRHRVVVVRVDGSSDAIELDSKDFLRHDLAHFGVESELALSGGVWGSVARGGRVDGTDLDGPDMNLAERIAGPMQTMMRTRSSAEQLLEVLVAVAPDVATATIASGIHRRLRALDGHWASTAYGEAMVLDWPE